MAKQRGIVKFEGTMGDITFLKTKDGFMAKEVSRVSKERIMTDPTYKRTRENMADFRTAAQTAKTLRLSLSTIVSNMKGERLSSRLFRAIYGVMKTDAVNPRGQRSALSGDFTLLTGFEFNGTTPFSKSCMINIPVSVDRVSGEVEFTIPALVPDDTLVAPSGATHFQFVTGAVEVDFVTGNFVRDRQQTAILPLGTAATVATSLTNVLTPNGTLPLFAGIGIQFFQEHNSVMYKFNDRSFNAFTISVVDA